MKKLFTSLVVLGATVSMSAQDATTWTKGQEVTSDLEWTNTKYEGSSEGWTYYNAGGNGVGYFYDLEKAGQGSVEMFNNAVGSEYYQVMWLPAGYYKFTVQGFYRPGSAWAAGWDTNTDQNGIFFCDAVTIEDELDEDGVITGVKYTTTRESNTMLRLLVSDASETQLLTDEMCGDWQRDSGTTATGTQIWCPNSMWGASLHFATGTYENELMVVNPEDGYVKIGIRKGPDTIGDDWIIFDNFRAYYESDAGEAVQIMLAQEEVAKAEKAVEDLQISISDTYGSLSALLGDELSELGDADDYNSTVEGCKNTVNRINDLIAEYKGYYEEAKSLTSLVNKCETLNNVAQDPTFTAALNAAKAIESDGTGQNEMTIESPKAYHDAEVALSEARITYLTSTEAVNGAYDFTTMINFPWFCNEEYNPTYNADEGRWYFPDYVLNGDGELLGFAETGESADTYKPNTGRVLVSDKVKIGTKETTGAWYQVGTSSYEPYFNHQYTSAKQWATPGNNREIVQIITGLPDGFYAAKGLGMTWSNDWDQSGNDPEKTCNMGIYIEAGEEKSVSTEDPIFSGWWQGWHPFDWNQYTTSMVHVTDGTVKVAFFANGFSSFTGMQLFYYGQTPDFSAMLAPEVEAAKALELTLAGDKAKIDGLLAQVPAKVNGYEEYDAARALVKEAVEYANAANKYMATWNASEKFLDLQSQYEEASDEFKMLEPTWAYALEYPETADATFLGAQDIEKDYNAYVNYFSNRANMMKVADQNAELKAELAKQTEAISAAYTTAETLAAYLETLAAPYNAAVLASLGSDKASETNPIDVTSLIVNPSFDNGNTGWEGACTVSNDFHNAESYNTSNFSVMQTIYSLPAGTYRVQVQSFYREGSAQEAFDNLYYNTEEGEWVSNVKVVANGNEADVMSLCQPFFTEPSMTERVKEWVKDDLATDEYHDLHVNDADYDPNKVIYSPVIETIDENAGYPFDSVVPDDKDYYYPNSMEGAMNRFDKSPEAYINTVEVYLPETGNITFGVKKDQGVGNDWCIFDNFKLFYLGGKPSTAINAVSTGSASAIYSVSGVRQNSLNRGVNIIKSADGVKKVIK